MTIATLSLLLVAFPAEGAEPTLLTVDATVAEARARSSDLVAAEARAEAAADAARSVRGRMLPGVRLSDEQQWYAEPFVATIPVAVGPPGTPAPSFPARDRSTNTFTATVAQPVLGLLHLSQERAALGSTADAAQESVKVVQAGVAEQVQIEYLRMFEARALAETARAAERDLEEEASVMDARRKIGVATDADVLRIRVAIANARQQEIQARAQERTSRATLLAALGRPPDDRSVEFAEPASLLAASALQQSLHDAVEQGLARRPEMVSTRLQSQSARQRARARLLSLLPEVNLEAGYVYIRGQELAPRSSTFVGVRADWAAFEWGATFYDQRAAERQSAAAAAEEEGARRRIGTEVAIRMAQADAANSAVEVAQTAIASAEEARRVTDALVKAGSATTTDLLDAQSALTQARLNLVRARYEQAIARVALARAVGE
jgi:outer membrane protein TolC